MAIPINLRTTGSVMVVEGATPAARMEINVPLTASSLSIASISLTSGSVAGDLIVNGTLIANEFKTTVVSASITYRSGSTKQGDSLDDVHDVTGSLRVLGGISGSFSGSSFGVHLGSVVGAEGLTGSLQRLVSGQTYLVGGAHISIFTQSNGQVLIAATELADVSASYVVVNTTGSLPNERFLYSGIGLLLTDNGPGLGIGYTIDNNVVATVSGTRFTGPVDAFGGLTGSLQRLSTGETYLAPGRFIALTTQSNGQVVIDNTFTVTGSWADVSASYVVLGVTGSLPNERFLSSSFGLQIVDNGAGSSVNLRVDPNEVATLTGSTFRGVLSASAGFSGSLQQVGPDLPYLVAGNSIQTVSQSNGQVLIGASNGLITASLVGLGGNALPVPNNVKYIIVTGATLHTTFSLSDHPADWQEHIFKDGDGAGAVLNIIISGSVTVPPTTLDGASGTEISSSYGWVKVVHVGNNKWSVFDKNR